MPVLSPHRSSSSGLAGSYRTTLGSSSLERPYYSSGSSYSPRLTSTYSERYSVRSYADSDGRRIFSRTGSITEDGLTTRFREESRECSSRRDSFSRDSGISSIREGSILDGRRESSLSRSEASTRTSSSDLSRLSLVETVADIRNKYSPANYVPAVLRNKDISRSKTLNDIGLPPIESKTIGKKKVTELTNAAGVPNNTNCLDRGETDNMQDQEDDNGNRPSVSEMRKRFDGARDRRPTKQSPLSIEGAGVRIADNRFKKLDGGSKPRRPVENGHAKTSPVVKKVAAADRKKADVDTAKSKVTEEGGELKGGKAEVKEPEQTQQRVTNHVNNFASYIPSRDTDKADSSDNASSSSAESTSGDLEGTNSAEKVKKVYKTIHCPGNVTVMLLMMYALYSMWAVLLGVVLYGFIVGMVDVAETSHRRHHHTFFSVLSDLTTSPRLNRSPVPQGSSPSNGAVGDRSNATSGSMHSATRGSSERDSFSSTDAAASRYDRSSPAKQLGLNGLKNIGNTCFMNSVIQCLSNTRPLLEYVKKDGYIGDINTTLSSMKGALIKAFAQVIKELWSEDSSDRVVNTASLKSQIQRFAPRFMGYSQQDAQEFLRYLLEGLHEDVNRVGTKPTPIHTEIDEKLSDSEKAEESWQRYVRRENSKVVDIFVGQLKSTLKCTHCGHCSVTFDPFWDLSLPIPQKTGGVRLSQCLESFTREETLDGDEKPTCSKCKERRKCTKSFSIHKFPKILVIHLKRFSPTERFRGKLSVTVDFPLEGLDMGNYASESHAPCRYNLYAISNHSGTTYSGHYTAYCRHPYSQSWHEYNDSRVSSISSKNIVSGEAYVLFYELDSKLARL